MLYPYENDKNPTVFVDDGGQAYIAYGNPTFHTATLDGDMISFKEETSLIEQNGTNSGFRLIA